MINEGVTYEILNLYENTFPKLTEQYFENTPWPDENEVSPIVDNDHVSVIFSYNCFIYITIIDSIEGDVFWSATLRLVSLPLMLQVRFKSLRGQVPMRFYKLSHW